MNRSDVVLEEVQVGELREAARSLVSGVDDLVRLHQDRVLDAWEDQLSMMVLLVLCDRGSVTGEELGRRLEGWQDYLSLSRLLAADLIYEHNGAFFPTAAGRALRDWVFEVSQAENTIESVSRQST